MSRRSEASPRFESKEDPRQQAERFFELIKQRGDLRRSLRSDVTKEEAVSYLDRGEVRGLLELFKARRHTASEKPATRLTRRLENDSETREKLEAIDREIKELVQDPGVHEAIHAIRHERVQAGQESERAMEEYRNLHEMLEELSIQDFDILRKKRVSSGDRTALKGHATLRGEVERRLRNLTESPETARVTRMAELMQYREQMRESRFAMTPSRRELADQIRGLWARGEAVLLTGPTGTGKTELFSYLTKMLYHRPLSRLIRSTQNVTPAEIFGKMGLKATKEGGTETFFQPGVYTDAIDQGMPFIIDEFNLLETKIRFGLKELYNRRPGDSVTVQEDSGEPHVIQEGFVFGATANVKGEKYKERFELDPAESRVFASQRVDFLPKEELYDVLLAQLLNDRGELRLSREDATKTLKHLLEATELSQQAFEGKQTQFYAEGAGTKRTPAMLEKAVFDPGRVVKIISGWPLEEARGRKFRDYLEDELLRVIRTEDYPEKDRRLLLQIFITKGFFNGKDAQQLGIPGITEVKLKAWGWSDIPAEASATEVLSSRQVADLDPFDLRKLRAGEAADGFLDADKKDVRKALEALRRINLARLPEAIRTALEKNMSADVIIAENKEGKEVRFDLAEIRRQWVQFYDTHGLSEILKDTQGHDTLPADIRLTPEQVDLLKAKAKEGYTRMILVPAGVEGHLQSLKENLTDGLAQDASNNPIPTFLSDNVKPNFPNQIQTTDPRRLGKAYLLMTNPDAALHPGTKDKSADEIIRTFADPAVNVSGLTLADYLIEERRHFDETGQHLVDFSKNEWTWLLASRDAASRVLGADWNPNNRQVGVGSSSPGDRDPGLGARSSVVLALES